MWSRCMPSWRAFCVIIWAKRTSLPAMCSATATATSLHDLVISALMASMSVISVPSSTSSLEGWAATALAEKRILVR